MFLGRINYIIVHLNMLIDLTEILDVMHFDKEVDEKGTGIYFPQSSGKLEIKNVVWIDEIPVLFPMGAPDKFYSIKNGSVVFEHDIFRSAFYLLSGEQEQDYNYSEPSNRYSWEKSIQKQLGITEKPIVNYYFNIIISGIKAYCELNGIVFKERKIFKNPVLFMSHDVDRVKSYHFARVKKYIKAFQLKNALSIFWGMIYKLKDPWWNFEELLEIEKKLNIKSTWFFLAKGIKHLDAYYSFSEEKISQLIKTLQESGHEIGIHGTIESAYMDGILQRNLKEQCSTCNINVTGIRQHWLNYYPKTTPLLQEKAGLKYDSTLGFHDHIGFRNSYCLPFKPYNFEKEEAHMIWEFPLIVMDGSITDYMGLDFKEAEARMILLMKETQKFNGIFTFLVHNNYLEPIDKSIANKRKDFFKKILFLLNKLDFHSLTGEQICNLIDRNE